MNDRAKPSTSTSFIATWWCDLWLTRMNEDAVIAPAATVSTSGAVTSTAATVTATTATFSVPARRGAALRQAEFGAAGSFFTLGRSGFGHDGQVVDEPTLACALDERNPNGGSDEALLIASAAVTLQKEQHRRPIRRCGQYRAVGHPILVDEGVALLH